MSVLLSSHALADLERVADYLVVLFGGQLRLAAEVDDLLTAHRVLTGPAAEADRYARQLSAVQVKRGEAQAHLLVEANGPAHPVPPGWEAHPVSLQELTLAYMRAPGHAEPPGLVPIRQTEPTEAAR